MRFWRRRGRWLVVGGVVAAVAIFILVWFQPQKLFIDERVDEALPVAELPDDGATDDTATGDGATDDTATDSAAGTDEVEELAVGAFVSLDHGTSGTVHVVELPDGRRFVRLEELATDNGPDLFLYLSANPADGPEGAFDDEYLNLGRLKGNLGNQNYDLPPEVVLDEWSSVVIWCDRFDSAFGAADLRAA